MEASALALHLLRCKLMCTRDSPEKCWNAQHFSQALKSRCKAKQAKRLLGLIRISCMHSQGILISCKM